MSSLTTPGSPDRLCFASSGQDYPNSRIGHDHGDFLYRGNLVGEYSQLTNRWFEYISFQVILSFRPRELWDSYIKRKFPLHLGSKAKLQTSLASCKKIPAPKIHTLQGVLGNFGISDRVKLQWIKEGIAQNSFLVKSNKGIYFLKEYSPATNRSQILVGLRLNHYLKKRSFPCPDIVFTKEGNFLSDFGTHYYSLHAYLLGHSYHEWSLNHVNKIRLAGLTAYLLANFHVQTKDFQLQEVPCFPRPSLYSDFQRLKGHIASSKGGPFMLAMKRSFPSAEEIILSGLALFSAGNRLLVTSILHGDWSGNLLFDKWGQPLGVVDYSDVLHGLRIFDLIYAILHHAKDKNDQRMDMQIVFSMLQEYHRAYPLEEEEIAYLPEAILFLRAASFPRYYETFLSGKRIGHLYKSFLRTAMLLKVIESQKEVMRRYFLEWWRTK